MFVKPIAGTRTAFWGLLLAFCLLGAQAAQAQIQPAKTPIVGKSLQNLLELIPGSPTDLPPYLTTSRDVYLLVTAGASYTEVDVLANLDVPPPTLARALASAVARTPLRGQTIKWSADSHSAAQMKANFSRIGSLHGSNTVPLGALVSGLRQAGLTPHLLLRVPRHAQVSSAQIPIPSMHYGTANFRWYDSRHLGKLNRVTVTARLAPASLAGLAACVLFVPLVGLLGLWLAAVLSGRLPDTAVARLRFRTISTMLSTLALTVQIGGTFYLLRTPYPAAFADLWFGSRSAAALVPLLVTGLLFFFGLARLAQKQEIRRFGPLPVSPALSIPMSDEEKAARKRVAQWSRMPHLVGAIAIGSLLFLVPRTSPFYSFIHPMAMLLPVVGAGLIGKILGKSLHKFTQTTLDDALTWRARQLGQALGVRMPDVLVEDSSRAAHLVFASHQGHHITLSRKMQAAFSPAETDFVLAYHLACMKRRGGWGKLWAPSLLPLLMVLPFLLILSPRFLAGAPQMTTILLSPWFFPVMLSYVGLLLVLMFVLAGDSSKRQRKQDTEADRAALEVTGNLAAAESALEKMAAEGGLSMMTPAGKALAADPAQVKAAGQAGQLLLRRLELQKTAQTLHFAPAPGTPAGSRPLAGWNPGLPAGEKGTGEKGASEETNGIPK